MEANLEVAANKSQYRPAEAPGKNNYIGASAKVSDSTQVGPGMAQLTQECLVGEGTSIGDQCSIKRSVIGAHCTIGNRVKIQNSVILDHTIIHDNAVISESIICDRVEVRESAKITDSQIGTGREVAARGNATAHSQPKSSLTLCLVRLED
jgi:translation initiation factor eIF-2B subunit gamma